MTTLLPSVGAAVVARLLHPEEDGWAVTAALAEHGIPALSVAVVRDGEVVHARAWGTRDVAGAEPVSTETRFLAGSVSKPVTACAALRLVADGVLDLDARLMRAGEHARFGHGGSDEGFLTLVEAGVDDGGGIVIMASSNAAGPLMAAVAAAVAETNGWRSGPVGLGA